MQTLKENIHDAIIEAATEEFYTRGYEKSSLRRIASAAGITAGNLYHYFGGKSELFEAVVSPAYEELVSFREEHEDSHEDLTRENLPELLEGQIQLFARILSRYRREIYILFRGSEGTSYALKIDKFIQNISDHAALHLRESPGYNLDERGEKILAAAMSRAYIEGWIHIIRETATEKEIALITRNYMEIYLTGPLSMIEKTLQ